MNLGLNIPIPQHLRGPPTAEQTASFRRANTFHREDEPFEPERRRESNGTSSAESTSSIRTNSRRSANEGKNSSSSSSPSSPSSSSSFQPTPEFFEPRRVANRTNSGSNSIRRTTTRRTANSSSSSSTSSSISPSTFTFQPPLHTYTPQPTPQPTQHTPQHTNQHTPPQQSPSFIIYYDINDGYGPMDTSEDYVDIIDIASQYDVVFLDAENHWLPIIY